MKEINTHKKLFYLESLGCPRNLVDSEFFAGLLTQNGYQLTEDPTLAELIIVNTCGFIKEAKEEAIEQILSLAELKKRNKESRLIVTGCLVKRYAAELGKSLPEIDHIIDLKDFHGFAELLGLAVRDNLRFPLESRPYSYLRISDGCNNHCSYCAIPAIRGKVTSEPETSLLTEARKLAAQGVKELILTAMDITQYGIDLPHRENLVDLLGKLDSIQGIEWIRLLYLHPAHVSDELLSFIKANPKVCPYLDIPIQHINDSILNRMNRKTNRREIEKLFHKIRTTLPQAALRTTVISGFPGESEEQFLELKSFLEEIKFNRLGVFRFSAEPGTKAYELADKVHFQTALRRKRILTELHDSLSEELLLNYVGKVVDVIIDRRAEDESFLFEGRTRWEAPDIDGLVFIKAGKGEPGDIVPVRITESLVHDLIGEIV